MLFVFATTLFSSYPFHEKESERNDVLPLLPQEKIRLAFIAQHPTTWPGTRSIWAAASQDPRFAPTVVLTPFRHILFTPEQIAQTYDDMRQCLIRENVPYCESLNFDPVSERPHVTFVQNPYEETRPTALKIDSLIKSGSRLAYVPYGLEMGGGDWNLRAQFNSPLHRKAWRVFSRSERHKAMFGRHCRIGNRHVVVTGHPKFDSRGMETQRPDLAQLQAKIAGRRVILWTPHFSAGGEPAWSTFDRYGAFILKEAHLRPDLFLLVRPHPLFFSSMRQKQIWNEEDERLFRDTISQASNMALDDSPNYYESFSLSDGLMADVGSFLLEYLPTGKPLMYLHLPNGIGLNDDGEELVTYLYKAQTNDDIASFMDMVGRGEDPKGAERARITPEFLYGLETNVGTTICNHIAQSLATESAPEPVQASPVHMRMF